MLLGAGLLKEFCGLTDETPEYTGASYLRTIFGTDTDDRAKDFVRRVLSPDADLPSLAQMDAMLADCFGGAAPAGEGRLLDNGGDTLKELIEDQVYAISTDYLAQDYWKTQARRKEKPVFGTETTDHFFPLSVLTGRIAGARRSSRGYCSWRTAATWTSRPGPSGQAPTSAWYSASKPRKRKQPPDGPGAASFFRYGALRATGCAATGMGRIPRSACGPSGGDLTRHTSGISAGRC